MRKSHFVNDGKVLKLQLACSSQIPVCFRFSCLIFIQRSYHPHMQKLIRPFSYLLSWIANIGISDSISFYDRKKTQLINLAVGLGIPVNVFFAVKNAIDHRGMMAIINICLMLGGITILLINGYRKFFIGRTILFIMASLIFSTSAIFFRNGGEYFLLLNVITTIIFFSEKKFLIGFTLINALLFIFIKIFLNSSSFVYDQVPFGRILFNIVWAMAMIVMALFFFKNEQLSYQLQIEKKNEELENINAAKQKLFSIISHDLRSPIGQLKSSLDLVNRGYLSPEEFKKITSNLSLEVDQLHSTLDNLLRWSISQFQGIVAKPEKVSLTDIIENKAILFLKQSIENKQIRFHFENAELFVWADPDHLMLVFRNLLSNAIKYSYQNGNITIRMYTEDNTVVTEIADSGMGMNEETKLAVFNPVSMVSNTGTSNEKGTGLGLKLCKEFIEKNNGLIWVESLENKGTTFYISLPAAQ